MTAEMTTPVKAFRVIFDEPVGICVGFQPQGMEGDEWTVYDEGGDEVFTGSSLQGAKSINLMLILKKDDKWPNGWWNKEGELMIWRTPDEFFQWMTDYR